MRAASVPRRVELLHQPASLAEAAFPSLMELRPSGASPRILALAHRSNQDTVRQPGSERSFQVADGEIDPFGEERVDRSAW